eukprot:sb/3466436/
MFSSTPTETDKSISHFTFDEYLPANGVFPSYPDFTTFPTCTGPDLASLIPSYPSEVSIISPPSSVPSSCSPPSLETSPPQLYLPPLPQYHVDYTSPPLEAPMDLPPSPNYQMDFSATSDYFSLDSITVDSFSLELTLPPPSTYTTTSSPPPSDTDLLSLIGDNSTRRTLFGNWQEATEYSVRFGSVRFGDSVFFRRFGSVRFGGKNPVPPSIFNGDSTHHLFKESSRDILASAYNQCAYPTPDEKRALCSQSGLTYSQVTNYFKNRRGRERAAGVTIRKREPEPAKPYKEDIRAVLALLQHIELNNTLVVGSVSVNLQLVSGARLVGLVLLNQPTRVSF